MTSGTEGRRSMRRKIVKKRGRGVERGGGGLAASLRNIERMKGGGGEGRIRTTGRGRVMRSSKV